MFDRIRAVINTLKPTDATTPVTDATPTPTTTAIVPVTPVTTSGSAAAAAPAPVTPELITISVNGIEQAKQYAVWLTKGKDRTQPTTAVRLVDCTSDHLKNIVANKPNLSADYRRIIESILEDRGETLPVAIVGTTDDPDDDQDSDTTGLTGTY
jgi:hypothetical protein